MIELKKTSPDISIIVTCFNYGQFLTEALESVSRQSFQDWECLIVDDGSTDNSAIIAQDFEAQDSRFKSILQKNMGLSAARNKGLNLARGKYIQFLDADDALASEKLEKQYLFLNQNPGIALVFGDALHFSNKLEPGIRPDNFSFSETQKISACGPALIRRLVKDNMFEVSCPLYRKVGFFQHGFFDENLRSYEDWDFWFRAALTGLCFSYIPEVGTETFIRKGHPSLMKKLVQMNSAGIQFRLSIQNKLKGRDAYLNNYRLFKLRMKRLFLAFLIKRT